MIVIRRVKLLWILTSGVTSLVAPPEQMDTREAMPMFFAKMLSFMIKTWGFTHEIRVRNGDVFQQKKDVFFYCKKGRVGQKKVEISHDLSSKDWLFTRQPWKKT